MAYQPVFHVTVCNSVVPEPAISAILLSVFAPSIYGSKVWLSQWRGRGIGQPHPGLLEGDNPEEFLDDAQLLAFADRHFATPMIVIDAGGECDIGSTGRINEPLIQELIDFFKVNLNTTFRPLEITRNVGYQVVGVYNDRDGKLTDSREVDYLYIAAKNGRSSIDEHQRRLLLSLEERMHIVEGVTGDFAHRYEVTEQLVDPEFIQWLTSIISATGIKIVDPNNRDVSLPLTRDRPAGVGSIWNM